MISVIEILSKVMIVMLAVFLSVTVFLTAVSLAVNPKKEYENDSRFYRRILYISSIVTCVAARIKIVKNGMEENIPPDGRFLLVSNHRSNFDPITTWTVLRKREDIVYVSKPENFNIPWFGRIIRRCGFMSIDRQNPRNAAVTINKAASLIKDDKASVAIFPEGTRSREGKLLPFHDGVFKIAQKAKVPIVVAAVSNTEKVKKNFPFHGTAVYIDFVDIITRDEVEKMSTHEIGQRVYNDLKKVLGENGTENVKKTKGDR